MKKSLCKCFVKTGTGLCKCNSSSSHDDVSDKTDDVCELPQTCVGYNAGDEQKQNVKLHREIVARNKC
jgi:hypothetical protein